ncbi:MAG TPA: hypothetical protein VFC63_23870 [Blastocatellia bacterium]|nr:hypothetical protein [Blastocatellia bacterium]
METTQPKKLTVKDYSESELEEFKKRFLPTAEKHHRRSALAQKIFLVAGVGLLILFVIALIAGKNSRWPLIVAIPCMVAFIVGGLLEATFLMHCPACEHGLRRLKGSFCPHCGYKTIERGFLIAAHCETCHVSYSSGRRGRHYTIRYCNSCGIPLNDKGL